MKRRQYTLLMLLAVVSGLISSCGGIVTAQEAGPAREEKTITAVEKATKTEGESHSVFSRTKDIVPWLALLVSIFVLLKDKLLRRKIEGKIISRYGNPGSFGKDQTPKLLFLFRVAVFSKNKDFFLKDIDGHIKFKNQREKLKCNISSARILSFMLRDRNGLEQQRTTRPVVSEKYLINYVVFPRNTAVDGYIFFYVDLTSDMEAEELEYEYFRLVFQDYSGKTLKLQINERDVNEEKLFFDDTIWE